MPSHPDIFVGPSGTPAPTPPPVYTILVGSGNPENVVPGYPGYLYIDISNAPAKPILYAWGQAYIPGMTKGWKALGNRPQGEEYLTGAGGPQIAPIYPLFSILPGVRTAGSLAGFTFANPGVQPTEPNTYDYYMEAVVSFESSARERYIFTIGSPAPHSQAETLIEAENPGVIYQAKVQGVLQNAAAGFPYNVVFSSQGVTPGAQITTRKMNLNVYAR